MTVQPTTPTTPPTSSPLDDERRQLQRACEDLVTEFGDRIPSHEVQSRFDDVVRRFEGAPVRTFVPVLAGRAAREEIRRLSV